MKRNRKMKVLSIIVLVLLVSVMSIGFAAFSSVLTISSSATVTPNSNEFKIKMYGLTDENLNNYLNIASYTDENASRIFLRDTNSDDAIATNKYATLNNTDMTISNIFTEINNPTDVAQYFVKVVNEGKFSAYVDTTQFLDTSATNCVPGEGTTPELVAAACNNLGLISSMGTKTVLDAEMNFANGNITQDELDAIYENDCFSQGGICEIKPNGYAILLVGVFYSSTESNDIDTTPRADGPFTAYFPDIKLEFTSTPPESQS